MSVLIHVYGSENGMGLDCWRPMTSLQLCGETQNTLSKTCSKMELPINRRFIEVTTGRQVSMHDGRGLRSLTLTTLAQKGFSCPFFCWLHVGRLDASPSCGLLVV